MFLFAALYLLSSSVTMKRIGFLMAAVFFVLTVCTFLISDRSYADQIRNKRAVVMSMSAYVKSSPGENNTDLFVLHEGTRMEILDSYDNWVKIRIARNNQVLECFTSAYPAGRSIYVGGNLRIIGFEVRRKFNVGRNEQL